MEVSRICFFFSLFFSLLCLCSASAITIPLSTFPAHHNSSSSSSDPLKTLSFLASATVSRAHHIKRPKSNSSSVSKTALYPKSYGAYSVSLSFGTPPQTLQFVFDTGSSLVWFPCTRRYLCSDCSFPNVNPAKIPVFIPKLSSSAKIVGCRNPKCELIFGPKVKSKCPDCDPKSQTCSQNCPAYIIQYGSGSTAGLLLSETLDFPEKKLPEFLVGCSFLSIRQPAGIAGFGRGPESLPSQMGLNRFSYCLVSRRFDDTPRNSPLILDSGSGSGESRTDGLSYTPFQKNPSLPSRAFREYYYVLLRKIIVGGKAVKIPYNLLVPGPDGNGGTIVDSGTTFTFLEKPVRDAVAKELENQMANYTRATDIEAVTQLSPCFDVSKEKSVNVPELTFQFKGGAKMSLPLSNYFAIVTSSGVACLTVITDTDTASSSSGGPAIILGSFQLQNFLVEYDLAKERFGFRRQTCG